MQAKPALEQTARPHIVPATALPAWLPWFVGRCAAGIWVVLCISCIVFITTQALPSDPARVILGPEAPEATVEILRQQLGLNQPILQQYWHWLSQIVTGDLGRSIDSQVPVLGIVKNFFGNTLLLTLLVIVLTVPIALLTGIWLALHRDSLCDRLMVSLAILFKAIPGFVLAIWLMMLLSISVFHLLPAASLINPEQPTWQQMHYLILPILTLCLSLLPYLMRLVRGSMIDALQSEYVIAARLRGIPERRIVIHHVLPNALVPTIQGIALSLRVLLSGGLVVEVVFSYPGIGNVVVNLLADLITTLLTPKLRSAKVFRARSPGKRLAMLLWKTGRPVTVAPVDRRNAFKSRTKHK
jgi:peptide/nickel transport system permease protein